MDERTPLDNAITQRQDPADTTSLDVLANPALDAVFMRPSRIDVPSAWYGHVPFAHWLIAHAAPRSLVELGSHNGVSYAAFCEAVAHLAIPARCTAVDTWRGDEHAGLYGDEVFDDLKRFHDPRFGGFSTMMRCTFDEARGFFADGSLDLLHIDGLHTYEAVRHDWENWRTALSERAVVLFHDVNERQGSFGVWRLWEELRAHYPSFTFLHSHGLGVLAVGGAAPAAVLDLCAAERDSAACSRLRERFAQLGERWDAHFEQSDSLLRRRAAEADNAGLRGELATLKTQAAAAGHDAAAAIARADQDAKAAAARAAELGRRLTREMDQALEIRSGLEAQVAELHAAREGETSDLRAQRDSAWSYQGWLEEEQRRLTADLAQAHADLAQRAEDWERVHRVLASRDSEIAQAQADALAARARAAEMEASASWQVAAPLRRLSHALPGVSRTARRTSELARLAVSGELGQRRALRRQREAEIAMLRTSPLFDAAFYLARHPEIEAAGHDPVAHYVWLGAGQGAMPSPYFDGTWYLSRHPDVAAGENPLLHWMRTGAAAGHDPNPFLDAAWYVARNPDAAADPLLHYVQVGAKAGLDPNPMLDGEGYLLEHVHARHSGMDALRHWWVFGAGMGLDPHPMFRAAWYRAEYGLPPDADPLAHWLQLGRHAGLPTAPQEVGAEYRIAFTDAADPEATVIVPVYGHFFDTVRTLHALATRTGAAHRFDVLVADDDPACRIAPLLQRRVPGLRTLENPENLGFLRSCNNAAAQTTGSVLVFLNNDAVVHEGWLAPLLTLMADQPDIGMAGCKMLNADGTLQEAGVAIPSDGWGIPYGAGDDPALPAYNYVRDVDAAVGACIAVRRTAWDAAGGFDDAYAPAFYEEFDLAFTLRSLGWRVAYQPASVVDHLGSNSYGAEMRDRQSAKNHGLFCRKWEAELAAQPPADASPLRLRQRPHDGRVLLFIDDRVPEWDRHAGALTNRQYIQLWRKLGYHVVLAPAAERAPLQPYTAHLQQEGVEILHGPGALEDWLARYGRLADVIWTARPDVTGPLLATLRSHSDAPILYYPHDIHHTRERQRWELERDPRALSESERLERVENRIFGAVDCVLCISEAEAAAVRAGVPGAPVQMVPAYIYPSPSPAPDAASFAQRDTILFVGGYAHLPNVDAARWLAAEIMPLVWRDEPSIRLVLAGSSPPAEVRRLAGTMVEVPGFVADLAPYHQRARMSVSPLRYGAGVKGKVVAALWEGLPVVSTPVGVDGLGLQHGVDCMIAGDAEALAACIVELWRNPARCAALAQAGKAVIAARFTAAVAASSLQQAIATARPLAAKAALLKSERIGAQG